MARVLIVDDDESERLLQRTMLQKAGHELFFARSGEEAVKVYVRSGIEVVISDLEMPDGDGLEPIEAITGLISRPTVIAVSGKGPDMLQLAIALGADVTLVKPVDGRDLIEAVAKAEKRSGPRSS